MTILNKNEQTKTYMNMLYLHIINYDNDTFEMMRMDIMNKNHNIL